MVQIPYTYGQYVVHYRHVSGEMRDVTITAVNRAAAEAKFFEIMHLLSVHPDNRLTDTWSEEV